jgi:thiamine biosynthesis lipoprotein
MAAESRFPVMGCEAHVVVSGPRADALVDDARARLVALERRWSRFLPDSEISVLNASAPDPVVVSRDTCALVSHAIDGWRATSGRFDPTVLGDVIRAGYAESFDQNKPPVRGAKSTFRLGCAGIVVDTRTNVIRLPESVGFDPGGIGKGFAADLVVDSLMRAGARVTCVNVGGDLRVSSKELTARTWKIDVLHPFSDEPVDRLVIADGAVATSSCAKRAWHIDGQPAHHLIDPSTGEPAATGCTAVTAVAGTAWRAEVLAKAALVAGPDDGLAFLEDRGVPALLFDAHGDRIATRALAPFCAPRPDEVMN